MINFESIDNMITEMLELDFTQLPNFITMITLRDALSEEYTVELANDIVASMEIDVSGISTPEEAVRLGSRWAEVVTKFIELMYDNGFTDKNIVIMASQLKLTFTKDD